MITWAEWARCYRAGRAAQRDSADTGTCSYSAGSADRDERARAYYWLRGWAEDGLVEMSNRYDPST